MAFLGNQETRIQRERKQRELLILYGPRRRTECNLSLENDQLYINNLQGPVQKENVEPLVQKQGKMT